MKLDLPRGTHRASVKWRAKAERRLESILESIKRGSGGGSLAGLNLKRE
jgi:hypothetical protein